MAIAAVAHVFVFSAKPYHFLPASEYGKVSTHTIQEVVKVEDCDEQKPALIEKTETKVEAPRTSVKESVQEIVMEGGQHVSPVCFVITVAKWTDFTGKKMTFNTFCCCRLLMTSNLP